jgi:hypothetical protein
MSNTITPLKHLRDSERGSGKKFRKAAGASRVLMKGLDHELALV